MPFFIVIAPFGIIWCGCLWWVGRMIPGIYKRVVAATSLSLSSCLKFMPSLMVTSRKLVNKTAYGPISARDEMRGFYLTAYEFLSPFGYWIGEFTLTFFVMLWSVVCLFGHYWHTRWGYQLRSGPPDSGRYAASIAKWTIWAMYSVFRGCCLASTKLWV